MSDWTAGYVADIGYTYGYYAELNPLRVRLAFLSAGLAFPQMGTACELGFGQGMSANIHAAASVTRWYGTDFNPSQAGFAQELAAAAGADAQLYDEAFAEFARRSDLPDFDYIGLHGIWSWISDENRSVIVDFVRRKLKVGGVLYISYNTQPGWAAMVPLRDLLTEHSEVMGCSGQGIVARIDGALAFAEKLMATNPTYGRANPQVVERLKKLTVQNRNYLAHEYFNRDWLPMPFSRMADWLRPAKLSYACSCHFLDHVDAVNLSSEQQALLREIPDPMFRETVRDFCTNQQFRKDYWVRGARRLTAVERMEALRSLQMILVCSAADVPLKVTGARGECTLQPQVYEPVLEALADHRPQSLGELEQSMQGRGVTANSLLQAVIVLATSGYLQVVQDEAVAGRARPQTDRLNAWLVHKARTSTDVSWLASPVTGGGVQVGRFQLLFLRARGMGKKQPTEWAAYAWELLAQQGQRIMKEGKMLETVEDNIRELTAQAEEFAAKRLPLLQSLGVA